MLSSPKAAVGWQGAVRLEPHTALVPWSLWLIPMIVLVYSPQTPAVGVFLAPVGLRIHSKLTADPLIGTAVIGVLKWGPRLILRKRCLKLIKNPAHLVIYVEAKDWSGQRTVDVKVVTPRDPTSHCSKPHCKVNLVLVETHGGLMPEADYLLRGNVWEPVFGEYVLEFCSEISSATTWLFRNNNLDMSFQ